MDVLVVIAADARITRVDTIFEVPIGCPFRRVARFFQAVVDEDPDLQHLSIEDDFQVEPLVVVPASARSHRHWQQPGQRAASASACLLEWIRRLARQKRDQQNAGRPWTRCSIGPQWDAPLWQNEAAERACSSSGFAAMSACDASLLSSLESARAEPNAPIAKPRSGAHIPSVTRRECYSARPSARLRCCAISHVQRRRWSCVKHWQCGVPRRWARRLGAGERRRRVEERFLRPRRVPRAHPKEWLLLERPSPAKPRRAQPRKGKDRCPRGLP